jgi:hypothetical protein
MTFLIYAFALINFSMNLVLLRLVSCCVTELSNYCQPFGKVGLGEFLVALDCFAVHVVLQIPELIHLSLEQN